MSTLSRVLEEHHWWPLLILMKHLYSPNLVSWECLLDLSAILHLGWCYVRMELVGQNWSSGMISMLERDCKIQRRQRGEPQKWARGWRKCLAAWKAEELCWVYPRVGKKREWVHDDDTINTNKNGKRWLLKRFLNPHNRKWLKAEARQKQIRTRAQSYNWEGDCFGNQLPREAVGCIRF